MLASAPAAHVGADTQDIAASAAQDIKAERVF